MILLLLLLRLIYLTVIVTLHRIVSITFGNSFKFNIFAIISVQFVLASMRSIFIIALILHILKLLIMEIIKEKKTINYFQLKSFYILYQHSHIRGSGQFSCLFFYLDFRIPKSSIFGLQKNLTQYYNINCILYMEKTFALTIFIATIITLSRCDIQTGIIDINRQMGNLDQINGYENALAYTHLFIRPFLITPQIATSITQFGTDSQYGFQIKIKTRKIQTDATKFKFVILARSIISIWVRLVMNYFITDRIDFAVNTISLQTADLSGLSNVPQQLFEVKLDKIFKNPIIIAFLNGFDIQTRKSHQGQLVFQASIQITEILKDMFTVSVKRVSRTEIYQISIGYIAADQIDTDGYSLQVKKYTQTIPEIIPQCPYIYRQQHQLNLENTMLMYGFEEFRFKYQQKQKLVKNLAILIQDKEVTIGSYDSKNLQMVSYSYIVIKQSFKCKNDQITMRHPQTRVASCRKCQTDKNKVPNKNGDKCICLQNHYQIKQKCYKQPQNGQWREQQKKFVCKDLYTIILNIKQDTYRCQKTPKNKKYDIANGKWVCISSFYANSKDECVKIPTNGFINLNTNQLQCLTSYQLIEGQCLKKKDNEQYSPSQNKFVCVKDSYRIKGVCLKPHPNSHYSDQQKDFVCNHGHYPKTQTTCEKIPDLMIFDKIQKKLVCQNDLFDIKDQGCKNKPEFMVYDPKLKIFLCEKDYYLFRGKCRKPQQNQEWDSKIKDFVCKSGAYRIKQKCLFPKPNTRYSQIQQNFVCIEGHYIIVDECLSPPPKMRYSQELKKFVCQKQYFELLKGQKIQCLVIPQNMKWDQKTSSFICIQNFFILKDEKCHKPAQNQIYNEKTKEFICKQDLVRIGKVCKTLPKNSIYDSLTNNFKCIQSYYQNENQFCQHCRQDCFQCNDAKNCKQCRLGFQLTKPEPGKQIHCIEKCGDGIRFNQECDDGNKSGDDGCSQDCKIQQGWKCIGGSPQSADKCEKIHSMKPSNGPITMSIEGMTHLYGKVILNVRIKGIQCSFLNNKPEITTNFFQVLTNSKMQLTISIMYLDYSEGIFVIIYDFSKVQPIPAFVTRIQINPQTKLKYYPDNEIKPLMLRIDPVYMALKDKNEAL